MIDIDPGSPVPLYQQIVDQIRRRIAIGALRAGDKLPTVRDLAVQAQVNRNTAARAIQHLEMEGLVATRVGRGTFVTDRLPAGDPVADEKRVDETLDRLVVEAHSTGFPLEQLGWRLSQSIDRFREAQSTASAQKKEEETS